MDEQEAGAAATTLPPAAPSSATTTTTSTSSDQAEKTVMKEQLIKLKRIAQLYKDEVGKHKKALIDSRGQIQQRNDMISKLKTSLVSMKDQQKKQRQQQKAREKQQSGANNSESDVLGARRPLDVLLRIRHSTEHWCLVRFESSGRDEEDDEDEDEDGGGDDDGKGEKGREDLGRLRWARQRLLETQAYEQYGMRMDMPDVVFDSHGGGGSSGSGGSGDGSSGSSSCSSSSNSSSRDDRELDETQQRYERVQEEFRRYRVKSEIQKKQAETELNRVMQANLAFQQRRIAGDDGVTAKLRESETKADDLSMELKSQQKAAHRLTTETTRLKKENIQLIQLLETGNRRRDSEGLNGKYKELQKEYDAYKRRASDALKHKDAAIKRALEQDGGHGGRHNKRSGMRDGVGGHERGGHERNGPRVLPKNPTTEYLKNTIIQYMATEQLEVKEHMEAAIATVLQFTREDVQFLKQKRDEAQGWLGSTVGGFFR